jgi:V/A-type H+-transporting ATPase subunit K
MNTVGLALNFAANETGILASLEPNGIGVMFTVLGVALSALLGGIGSAIGVGIAGQAAAGVVADQPERFGNVLVLQLLPGTQGIYGFAVAIMILIFSGLLARDTDALTLQKGLSFFIASLPVGIGGISSAIYQGKVAASGIQMLAKRPDGFGNGMMFALMVETYALLGLIISVFLVLFA